MDVLLEPLENSGYRATSLSPAGMSAEGNTRRPLLFEEEPEVADDN